MSETVTAIRAIGPKAVPHLLRMLSAKETALGELQRELRKSIVRRSHRTPPPWQLQRRGFLGLQILGPAAASAVPKILEMLHKDSLRMDLWFLLGQIGPASAVAAPLLERTLSRLPKNPHLGPDWLHNDFHPQWLASDLFMTWDGSYRALLLNQLRTKTNSLIQRVCALWSLRKTLNTLANSSPPSRISWPIIPNRLFSRSPACTPSDASRIPIPNRWRAPSKSTKRNSVHCPWAAS
jgi:hypothetical protein